MNAVGISSSETHINAKSCIQALLRTREYRQIQSRALKFSQRNINHFSGGFAVESEVFKNPAHTDASNLFHDQETPYEDVDNQKDFNYSQKLFHISDGNLYSILSPVQGRSYGMKPSFLRKQKYTVQECHSRGRKNLRKGLKFHNFLPSESVTSEKDNGVSKTKWKVHSECRLREEHGTKQITISNWSHSVQSSSEDTALQSSADDYNSCSAKNEQNLSKNDNADISTENIRMPEGKIQCDNYANDIDHSFENNDTTDKDLLLKIDGVNEESKQHLVRTVSSKKGSLKSVLNSLLDKPIAVENSICDLPEAHSKCSLNLKHRRKPIQTRRVVPYTKYLSILEEDDSFPLDLSSKSFGEKCPSPNSTPKEIINNFQTNKSNCDDLALVKTKSEKSDNLHSRSVSDFKLSPTGCNSDILVNTSSLAHLLQNQIVSPLVFLSPSVKTAMNIRPSLPDHNKLVQKSGNTVQSHNFNLNTNQVKSKNYFAPQHMNPGTSFSNNVQYGVHKSLVRNSQPKTRRRSQRSVIKKNLEDTFKQNGFLVKTKQVSDGEATFCKFRQLRKYTRYYLKSWQQHLPDEVHKMWKGFLPPKTVLPPVLGSNNPANGSL